MAVKAGWTDVGYGNLVKNDSTGEMVDQNHPDYVNAAGAVPAPAPSSGTAGSAASGPITTAQQVTGTSTPVGQTAAAGTPATVASSVQAGIVNNLNPQALTASDPRVAPAIQANQLSEQRSLEANRNLLAEQNAAEGTNNSGGADAGMLGLAQDSAARQGQFAGGAVQHLGDLQNQDMLGALAAGSGLLGANQATDLQRALANQSNSTQLAGIAQQGQLGNSDIALRDKLGSGQLNLGLLTSLLQNQQFGQNLGANIGMFTSNQNQQALFQALGML